MVRVKICGITNLKDAETAIACGADALGFIFAESPRSISPREALRIRRKIGPWITTVGVFVNAGAAEIRSVAAHCGLNCVQLHGDESPEVIQELKGLTVIKTFRVGSSFNFKKLKRFDTAAYLFDTRVEGVFGGTGKTFCWDILKSGKIHRPMILSGGLNPKNIQAAIRSLKPYGVDVSTGVEKSPGQKDAKLVKEFIKNAKKTTG